MTRIPGIAGMAGIAGAVAAAAALSACGASVPAHTAATSTTAKASTTTSSTTPTSTTSASAPTSTTATPTTARGTSGPCTTAQLGVQAGRTAAAAGHEGVALVFVNNGSAPCTTGGYPGVAGLDSTGHQVTQAVRAPHGYLGGIAPGATPPEVTLSPGQSASALVEGTSVPTGAGTCPTYASLLVTPPNETHSVNVAVHLPGCSGLQVHPVVPGTTGSES